jgi:hypothetical protein
MGTRPVTLAHHQPSTPSSPATCTDKCNALTLVLRSTHSSQLSVGLLRFCFFLGGTSPCGVLLTEGSGLDDGCVPTSSIVAAAQATIAIAIAIVLGSTRPKCFDYNATIRRAWRACHAKSVVQDAGISEDDVVSRRPRKRVCVEWGRCGDASYRLAPESRVWNSCLCYVSRYLHVKVS